MAKRRKNSGYHDDSNGRPLANWSRCGEWWCQRCRVHTAQSQIQHRFRYMENNLNSKANGIQPIQNESHFDATSIERDTHLQISFQQVGTNIDDAPASTKKTLDENIFKKLPRKRKLSSFNHCPDHAENESKSRGNQQRPVPSASFRKKEREIDST